MGCLLASLLPNQCDPPLLLLPPSPGLYYNASPASGHLNRNRQPYGFQPRAPPHLPAGFPLVLESTLSQVKLAEAPS